MNTTKLISFGGMMVFGALVTVSGCNNLEDGGNAAEEGDVASVNLAVNGVFDYNSMEVIAVRDGDADAKYPCVNYAKGCFNFPPNSGGVPEPADYGAKDFEDLCPTENVNKPGDEGKSGKWKFFIRIFNNLNCTGEEITGKNFDCYDPENLPTLADANQSRWEDLDPGENENVFLCVSQNAEKTFDLTSCAKKDPPAGADSSYACGCEKVAGACNCGFDETTLPGACIVDPTEHCRVVCTVGP
ncbi:hypothetical protein [Polyangium spumosum]|uniref:Lipoprotein n=1 Tax=Polyangium spumosum TaxID=889282 RepID=A0A6N7PNT3_9BACT|nr:hypothetical protein [Polyangium spumosum]MRG91805.1 hypothetical protein [Polyangium spumosum]